MRHENTHTHTHTLSLFRANFKSVLTYTILGTFAFLLFACEQNGSQKEEIEFNLKDFNVIGIKHNDGLNAVLNNLKHSMSESTLSLDETFAITDKSIKNFISHIGITNIDVSNYLRIARDAHFTKIKSFSEQESSLLPFGIELDVWEDMSFELKQHLSSIFEIFNLNDDVNTIHQQMDNFVDSIEFSDNLSETEKIIIASGAYVLAHSYDYWTENIHSWLELDTDIRFFKQNNDEVKWASLKQIATADAQGAVVGLFVGAAGGAKAGVVAGGVGAIPGALAGAATGAIAAACGLSAYTILSNIF